MGRYADFDPDPTPTRKLDASCIRPAVLADADALFSISAERDAEPGAEPQPPLENILRRIHGELEGMADEKPWHVFVAQVEDAVVAFGRVRRLDHAESGLPTACPEGWYLTGVIVRPAWRRRGLGTLLIRARLNWLRARTAEVHYVSNKTNRVSIAAHAAFGFRPQDAEFAYPRAELAFGEGRLHTLALS